MVNESWDANMKTKKKAIKVLLPEASESLGKEGRGVLSLKHASALNF